MGAHFRFNQSANPIPSGTVDQGRDDIWKGTAISIVVTPDGDEADCEILVLDAPAGSALLGHHVIGDFTPPDIIGDEYGPYEVEVRVRDADLAAGNRLRLVFNVTRDELGHVVDGGFTEPAFGEEQKEGADTSKGWDYRARAWVDALYPTFADKTELRAHIANRQKACFVPGLGILDWDAGSSAADNDDTVYKPVNYTSEAGRWILRTIHASGIAVSGGAEGNALVLHSGKWVPSNNFSAQNVVTTGRITVGGAVDTQGVVIVANAAQTANLVELRRSDASVALRVSGDAAVIEWGAAVTAPTLKQADNTTNGATGQPLTIQAANATGTAATGADIVLKAGTGTTISGNVLLSVPSQAAFVRASVGGINALRVGIYASDPTYGALWFGDGTPSSTNYTLAAKISGATFINTSSAVYFVQNDATPVALLQPPGGSYGLWFTDSTADAEVRFTTTATASATGRVLTIRAQNASGTTSTGGILNLASGSGTSANGVINLQPGGTTIATVNGSGVTTTQKLIANSGGAVATIQGYPGSEASNVGIWLGGSAGTGTAVNLVCNGTNLTFSAAGVFYFYQSNTTGVAALTTGGLRIGDTATPTERLDILGNIKIDTSSATPKIYQANNTTNGATATSLTVQAQNATGTTSTGGALILSSGTGTTVAGQVQFRRGATVVGGFHQQSAGYETFHLGVSSFTASNFSLMCNGAQVFINAPTGGIDFRTANSSTAWLTTTGLRIGDNTNPTERLDVFGRAKIGVGAGKVILDSYPATPSTEAAVWLGQSSPGNTNYALHGNATDVVLNAPTTKMWLCVAASTVGTIRTTGLRLGDGGNAAQMLDVLGNATATGSITANSAGGKAVIRERVGYTATFGGVYLGPVTASGTNYSLAGNGTTQTVLNVPTGGWIFIAINDVALGNFSGNGLRLGDSGATTATDRLEVVGNIRIASATAQKIYQQDNASPSATAAALTIQAANATGGLSTTGGDLILTSGTGATAGVVNIQSGGSTKLTVNATGATVTGTLSATDISVTGSLTANSGGGKAVLAGLVGSVATHGAIYLGAITPSASNYHLAGDASTTLANAGSSVQFGIANSTIVLIDATTLSFFRTVTNPKIYQRDNTTNAVTASTLTIQAANATGTTSTGGTLVLTSGTGTTVAGSVTIQTGGSTVVTVAPSTDSAVAITRTQGSSTFNTTTAHLRLENPAGGQTLVCFTFAGTALGGIRADNVGNFNWACGTGGYHQFYRSLDTSVPILNVSNTGICVVGPAGTAATERVDVRGGNIILTWGSAAKIYQSDFATNGGTGPVLTIQAANATGTTSTGGTLVVTSGTGTTIAGNVDIRTGGTTAWLVSPSKITLYNTVTLSTGTAVPSASEVDGSFYLRSGSPNGSAYIRANGAWVQLGTANAQSASVSSSPYTILSGSWILYVDTTAARTLNLPTPTAGVRITVIDVSGSCATNNITLARNASEQIAGVAANYAFATNWGAWTVHSNGTNWFIE